MKDLSVKKVIILVWGLTLVLTVPANGETALGSNKETEPWVTIGMTPTPTPEQPTPTESEEMGPEKTENSEIKNTENGDGTQKSKSNTDYTVEKEDSNDGKRVFAATTFLVIISGLML